MEPIAIATSRARALRLGGGSCGVHGRCAAHPSAPTAVFHGCWRVWNCWASVNNEKLPDREFLQRQERVDEELADETALTCPQQEVYLQYIYSTAFLCLSAANAFFGIFLDVAGRTIVLMGLLISMVGMLMLAYGDSQSGNGMSIIVGYSKLWFIVGYSLIGIGGFPTYIASFQLVQLFEFQGVFCSFISGLFNSSGYVFMLLMIGHISRHTFFLGSYELPLCQRLPDRSSARSENYSQKSSLQIAY